MIEFEKVFIDTSPYIYLLERNQVDFAHCSRIRVTGKLPTKPVFMRVSGQFFLFREMRAVPASPIILSEKEKPFPRKLTIICLL